MGLSYFWRGLTHANPPLFRTMIWCILAMKLTFLQFSTFVNENIDIVLDSCIDILTYYFNFLVVWMRSVCCCSKRIACSGRVSWSSKQVLPLRGSSWWSFSRGSNFVSGGGSFCSPPLRGGWINSRNQAEHPDISLHCVVLNVMSSVSIVPSGSAADGWSL